jgi:hypothetical protein
MNSRLRFFQRPQDLFPLNGSFVTTFVARKLFSISIFFTSIADSQRFDFRYARRCTSRLEYVLAAKILSFYPYCARSTF